VQVLCPMHRGPAGAGVLNEKLQEALTPARPGAPERRVGGRVYQVGDKVTQFLRNNYDKEVFNGSVGVVIGLSLEDQELRVLHGRHGGDCLRFPRVRRADARLRRFDPPLAGDEYPCVVVPLTSAWLMLQRNLLYTPPTAVTRAKRIVTCGQHAGAGQGSTDGGGGAMLRRPGRTLASRHGRRRTVRHSGNQGGHRLIMTMRRGQLLASLVHEFYNERVVLDTIHDKGVTMALVPCAQ